jgi:hypothetical protein
MDAEELDEVVDERHFAEQSFTGKCKIAVLKGRGSPVVKSHGRWS